MAIDNDIAHRLAVSTQSWRYQFRDTAMPCARASASSRRARRRGVMRPTTGKADIDVLVTLVPHQIYLYLHQWVRCNVCHSFLTVVRSVPRGDADKSVYPAVVAELRHRNTSKSNLLPTLQFQYSTTHMKHLVAHWPIIGYNGRTAM